MQRRLRIVHFSSWADRLEDADAFLRRLPALDLTGRVTDAADPGLMRMARLDCDWHGENTRVFAAMKHETLEFLPARVTGIRGLLDLAKAVVPDGEDGWLIFDGQSPQKLTGALSRLMPLLERNGLKTAWYSFDESSRTIAAFKEIAPYLQILIHDEWPLDPTGKAFLRRDCLTIHRSWVANLIPFAVPFNEAPEEKILFLGSTLGLTDHRKRQLEFLRETFGQQFVSIHDHSVSVADRAKLNRFKVSVCPEGRKFTIPAMAVTHTDRPFWSGCMGLVPVSEDSRTGARLKSLADRRLLSSYQHGNLAALKLACERGLNASTDERRRIYDHFNREETVGTVLAGAIATHHRG